LLLAAAPELTALPRGLLGMQRHAQEQGYAAVEGEHSQLLIERDGRAIGRLWTCATEDAVVVLDIALMDDERGQGVATEVLGAVISQATAAGLPVRLHVTRRNVAAQRLYERLGFRVAAADAVVALLERLP
jgi:ribosomal protein S18 acetylase RimI-like enzyme